MPASGRLASHTLDGVCLRCGLEEHDATPKLKKKTARWCWPEAEMLSAKPACLPKEKL